jgi:hypothetical protein
MFKHIVKNFQGETKSICRVTGKWLLFGRPYLFQMVFKIASDCEGRKLKRLRKEYKTMIINKLTSVSIWFTFASSSFEGVELLSGKHIYSLEKSNCHKLSQV